MPGDGRAFTGREPLEVSERNARGPYQKKGSDTITRHASAKRKRCQLQAKGPPPAEIESAAKLLRNCAGQSFTSGKRIVNVVPICGVLSTLIEPLWSSITFFVMYKPSPVPLFPCLVVK